MALLEVSDLRTSFYTRGGVVRAVDGVSFTLDKGETLGIVGESGSGKSVTCYSLMKLIPEPPGRIESGTAIFDGQDLLRMSARDLRKVRGNRISMIFQDPMTSLNPYLRISTQLIEALRIHRDIDKKAALNKAIAALEEVGIPGASSRVHQYPHEFSGGMRQRVMIAMALITEPDLLIADEPTTALDVTVQAQILDIIKERQERLGTAVILVTHDLGVVAGTCDKVNVMYGGKLMESGTAEQVFYDPIHPYTRSLQKTIPSLQTKGADLYTIPGLPPDVSKPINGCAFYPRCPYPKVAQPEGERPQLVENGDGHCFADCRFCDSSAPIESVLPKHDAGDVDTAQDIREGEGAA
ncbi:MAG: dipeptide/oligopeptide/nickel ABC transporter ATP-binding protein [Croceicoccus sp.]|nr:dipeptide/oligopeptide/nickel ABC transporter ATP-binding protein [Croceicoccus sp.]|tara:strand:- start:2379 stop:3437 length:1059 start_codon:yes stop_codon:yes gene_type:complete